MWLDKRMPDRVITVSSNVEDTLLTGRQRPDPKSARAQGKDEYFLPVQRGAGQGRPFTEHAATVGESVEGEGR